MKVSCKVIISPSRDTTFTANIILVLAFITLNLDLSVYRKCVKWPEMTIAIDPKMMILLF